MITKQNKTKKHLRHNGQNVVRWKLDKKEVEQKWDYYIGEWKGGKEKERGQDG